MMPTELAPCATPADATSDVGCVVIGRNEGDRLELCLRAALRQVRHVVYVDSGSTDGSVERARALGAEVVGLDRATPFTAARARAVGFRALRQAHPECSFVQFVDGDTELCPDWLAAGAAHLRATPRIGVVAGRQHERSPNRTPFHRMFDVEWDTPRGIVKYCAGNAMVRASAYEAAGGYRRDLIAGEEPELCVRIRRGGHLVEALGQDMAVHDAGEFHFRQWWRRSVRAGHAFAEGAHLHGASPERHYVRETARIVFWAALLPALALVTAPWTSGLSLLALPVGYACSAGRAYRTVRGRGRPARDARLAAMLYTLGKVPELLGVLRFHLHRMLRRRPGLIEYKRGAA